MGSLVCITVVIDILNLEFILNVSRRALNKQARSGIDVFDSSFGYHFRFNAWVAPGAKQEGYQAQEKS